MVPRSRRDNNYVVTDCCETERNKKLRLVIRIIFVLHRVHSPRRPSTNTEGVRLRSRCPVCRRGNRLALMGGTGLLTSDRCAELPVPAGGAGVLAHTGILFRGNAAAAAAVRGCRRITHELPSSLKYSFRYSVIQFAGGSCSRYSLGLACPATRRTCWLPGNTSI